MLDTIVYKDTHSEYVILIPCPLQQWLHESATMLHYTYVACRDLSCSHISSSTPPTILPWQTTHEALPSTLNAVRWSSIIVPRSSVALSEVRTAAIFTTFCRVSSFDFIGTASMFRRTPHHFLRPTSQTSPKPENDNNYPSTGYIFVDRNFRCFEDCSYPFQLRIEIR
jgi:hypothetical protein